MPFRYAVNNGANQDRAVYLIIKDFIYQAQPCFILERVDGKATNKRIWGFHWRYNVHDNLLDAKKSLYDGKKYPADGFAFWFKLIKFIVALPFLMSGLFVLLIGILIAGGFEGVCDLHQELMKLER